MSQVHLVEAEALTFARGDRVLVTVREKMTPDVRGHVEWMLKRRFPGVEFTVVPAVVEVAVQRDAP